MINMTRLSMLNLFQRLIPLFDTCLLLRCDLGVRYPPGDSVREASIIMIFYTWFLPTPKDIWISSSVMWFLFSILSCTTGIFSSMTVVAGCPWRHSPLSGTRPWLISLYYYHPAQCDLASLLDRFYASAENYQILEIRKKYHAKVFSGNPFLPQGSFLIRVSWVL